MSDLASARTAVPTLDAALLERLGDSILPVGEAATLPPELYTSPDVLAFETEALFRHDWVCVGRASRVANVGDWFTVDIVGEPIVIVRDKAGEVRAMSAVCQHRAMQVCEGAGNSTTFKCPYHHWNYALDGRLLGAPAMEQTIDFDKSEFGLPQLRVELWEGFVFVNFDPEATPLAPTLERYTPMLTNFDLANAASTGTFTLRDLPWNWKVMFENFNDGYHANRLHQFVQDFCPSSMTGFPIEWDDDSNVIFRTAGYTHIDGGFNATHRAIMDVFPRLTDEERSRSTFALMPPTLCFGTAPDQCFFFLVWPTGPETIDLEIGYLFHPSALDDPLFEQKLELSDMGVQVFVRQDQDATSKVQRGLRSRYAPCGRYSWQEESHVQFNRWLVQRYRKHSAGACPPGDGSRADIRRDPVRRGRVRTNRVGRHAGGGRLVTMEYRTLGRTGVQVSRYGLGTMVLGAWGNTDHASCSRIVHRALDAGINLVDCADVYAFGESEEIIGEALKDRRDDVVLATKFHNPMGSDVNQRGNSRRWITRAVDDSLRRLQTDHIDLYQIHRPDPSTDIAETIDALTDLVRAGKILSWGTSTFPAADLVETCWAADRRGVAAPHSEQPPYSILCRGIERDVLPTCIDHGIGVLVWSPLSGGWLTGKYRREDDAPAGSRGATNPDHFDGSNPAKFDAVERLAKIADDAGISMTHLALAWSTEHPAVTSALIGPRTEEQLDDLLGASDVFLGSDVLDAIDEVVAPGTDVNPADAGWSPPGLAASARRR